MKELLTTDDLAKLLGYSKATVNTYVALNKLPKPKKNLRQEALGKGRD